MSDNPYRGHRFPREIISYAVWFYYRFAVSFRDTEEAMAAATNAAILEGIRYLVGCPGPFVPRMRRLGSVYVQRNGLADFA